MKHQLKYFLCILLTGLAIITACKKEKSCEGCNENNKPPIANAGPDQLITLPTDSISLDGKASTDPDGIINEWLWTKISGPASFTIIKPTDSITKIKTLVAGLYQFEIKVTDNGGLSAKDTVQIIVDDPAINQPPVAKAGADQSITLPTDNILLDGDSSFDPDGFIVFYKWIKIAGPVSTNIIKPDSSKTLASALVMGVYEFELTVKDSSGALGKDTVRVNVSDPNNNPGSTMLECNVSMSVIGKLPTPGIVNYSFAAGTKLLFARGVNGTVDIYDTLTRQWKTVSGMFATSNFIHNQEGYKTAKVGSKIIFSAMADQLDPSKGQIVNIYDTISGSWSVNHLSRARSFYTLAVADKKAYYTGGSNDTSKMDVYNANTNSWSVVDFSEARRWGMSAIAYGSKIFFAGGFNIRNDSLVKVCDDFGANCDSIPGWVASDRIDILDVSTNAWSVAHLSEARGGIALGILGNKIVFAGGVRPYIDNFYERELVLPVVDFYNTTDNSWSASSFGPANTSMIEYDVNPNGIHIIGTKMLIQEGGYSSKIHIYDNLTSSWSVAQMPHLRSADMLDRGKIVSLGNKLLFFGQYSDMSNHGSTGINIYNSSTNTWCHTRLNFQMGRTGVVRGGNSVYVAGGLGPPAGCCNTLVDTVWRFDF